MRKQTKTHTHLHAHASESEKKIGKILNGQKDEPKFKVTFQIFDSDSLMPKKKMNDVDLM